ncbi:MULTISPECIES: NCS2 family permease [Vibrio]|jgi:AGZA family xanthine/uracil permease-like MFS transporter|uniref:Guanine permease n=5 Tax=Vibrio cyclitrophicus TaxID=47951 RepID=A0A7Z1S1V9_9VIBR|nr:MULTISPECIES: NCS2 family permease [Vibrio]KNH14627.1 guanine permease [Vibrio lentus]MBY7661008.1 NCS2 family permease [Vibrio atlanticus]ERM60054.1 Xanthine/uracil/thiamine/ascorbate permease family protein [Vibrio cyclitrophicus FF75]KAA8600601.1 Xanthine/uracil/thiamine/ascorbate permease family protein [Vibrio cyclitrophicus]MBE8556049.1 NCS2 family permease [Vibrio sp. OPT24]|tara:strand:- start:931 stop:2220 length:1290 start_codon:yes stop_codon:yes gene_type:complete
MFEKLFKLSENGTNVRTEIIAGLTTFLTMAYIIFVNPMILADAGMDHGAVFVATCLAAAIGCFIMGFVANYPIAQAPGMGLNAFFTYAVVMGMGYTWQVALAAVFVSGVIFIFLSIFKIREWIINSIPMSLRVGISAGIGLFLAFIALSNAGIVVSNPATKVSLGDITAVAPILGALGFFLTIALVHRGVKGAVMIAILAITAIGIAIGDVQYGGIMSTPPSLAPTFMQLDFSAVFEIGMISVVFAFLFVDLFDTAGTLVGVATKANLIKEDGKLPRLNKALLADSTATSIGALLGTSNTTSYVESVAGVAEGGRTGLTAVVVGILFLLALFFSPLAGMIPAYATSGALFYVAILMMSGLVGIDWRDLTEAAPVVVTCLLMPLTYSIAEGISLGFIAYAAIKLLSGKGRDVSPAVWVMSAIFILKYIFA